MKEMYQANQEKLFAAFLYPQNELNEVYLLPGQKYELANIEGENIRLKGHEREYKRSLFEIVDANDELVLID